MIYVAQKTRELTNIKRTTFAKYINGRAIFQDIIIICYLLLYTLTFRISLIDVVKTYIFSPPDVTVKNITCIQYNVLELVTN